ncbi:uncharacterized protein J7T54_006651 [Emericellopsis cladophorae]|uniref:Uncharacterized protein n=1 Tax=Emericellopsis cladophorae TaxID=2686198 RepID=A0A9P9Y723_9HYPO|nr:uncharacterized protein J7T54_006651 [Emericellopsis cladophorae]KAI6784606.1 hypothetical protein J7T54_006651 [Emericellopsis cladophorae]
MRRAGLDHTETIDETTFSVRFKHGIHTLYLFVDPSTSMAAVSQELREMLRERYPGGLTSSLDPPKTTMVPDEASKPKMAYGVLSSPSNPDSGWKQLKIGDEGTTTAMKAGLKTNSIVAFTFLENEDEDPVFEVEWPRDDDEMEDA